MLYNQHVSLISNKDYIIGLIEGYCNANQLPLEIFSKDNSSYSSNKINKSQLIIIDASQPGSSLNKSNFSTIAKISKEHHIPVCTIVDQKNVFLKKTDVVSWIDCFFEAPVLEHLDDYFRIHFHYKPHPFPDRRIRDRRVLGNRRRFNDTESFSLTKPFDQDVTKLKRTESKIKLNPFEIDNDNQSVFLNGFDLDLTCKEFKLFSLLATNIDHAFSADEIIQHLWPEGYRANKSDLYQYMHLLRKKVEEDPDNPRWIKTVKRVGYKLDITSKKPN